MPMNRAIRSTPAHSPHNDQGRQRRDQGNQRALDQRRHHQDAGDERDEDAVQDVETQEGILRYGIPTEQEKPDLLADQGRWEEAEQEFRAKLVTAAIYPTLLAFVGGIGTVLLVSVAASLLWVAAKGLSGSLIYYQTPTELLRQGSTAVGLVPAATRSMIWDPARSATCCDA